jgi:hypothetical protein
MMCVYMHCRAESSLGRGRAGFHKCAIDFWRQQCLPMPGKSFSWSRKSKMRKCLLLLSKTHHNLGWSSAKDMSSTPGTVDLFMWFLQPGAQLELQSGSLFKMDYNISWCSEMSWWLFFCLIGRNMLHWAYFSSSQWLFQEVHTVSRATLWHANFYHGMT